MIQQWKINISVVSVFPKSFYQCRVFVLIIIDCFAVNLGRRKLTIKSPREENERPWHCRQMAYRNFQLIHNLQRFAWILVACTSTNISAILEFFLGTVCWNEWFIGEYSLKYCLRFMVLSFNKEKLQLLWPSVADNEGMCKDILNGII